MQRIRRPPLCRCIVSARDGDEKMCRFVGTHGRHSPIRLRSASMSHQSNNGRVLPECSQSSTQPTHTYCTETLISWKPESFCGRYLKAAKEKTRKIKNNWFASMNCDVQLIRSDVMCVFYSYPIFLEIFLDAIQYHYHSPWTCKCNKVRIALSPSTLIIQPREVRKMWRESESEREEAVNGIRIVLDHYQQTKLQATFEWLSKFHQFFFSISL